jgi:hypothetical protein
MVRPQQQSNKAIELKNWKPFKDLKGGQRRKVTADLRKFINHYGGENPQELLDTYYSGKKGTVQLMKIPQIKALLDILKNCHSTSEKYGKRQFLSIVQSAGFSFSALKKSGWEISKNLKGWETAQKHSSELFPGAPVPEKRGRKKIKKEVAKSIIKFVNLDDHSYPSSNRTIKMGSKNYKRGKFDVPVKYRNKSVSSLYDFWCLSRKENNQKICSETKFRNILKVLKYLKKPKKSTDMCDICEKGKKAIKKIPIYEKKRNRNILQEAELIRLREVKDLYEKHKKLVEKQKFKFNEQITNLGSSRQVVLVIDFKQNLKINQNHCVEINKEWYTSPQRTVFGAVLYYNENGIIKKYFMDMFSLCITHNSYFVIKALNEVFSTDFFVSKKFNDVSFWMDNGPHFKTRELMGFFSKSGDGKKIKVQWNYFGEYHGKNPCDTRFSKISSMYKAHISNQNNFIIKDTSDLIEAIKYQQQLLNERRENDIKNIIEKNEKSKGKKILPLPKPPTYSSQLEVVIDEEEERTHKNVLVINDVKEVFYSFKITEDNKIISSVHTGDKQGKIWEKKYIDVKLTKKRKRSTPLVNDQQEEFKLWAFQKGKFIKINNFYESQPQNEEVDLFSEIPPKKRRRIIRLTEKQKNYKKRDLPISLFLADEDYDPQLEEPKQKKFKKGPTPNIQGYILGLANMDKVILVKRKFLNGNIFFR